MTKKQKNYSILLLVIWWVTSLMYAYDYGAIDAHQGKVICTYEAEWSVWDCDNVVLND
jgi:hypothetical protein